LSTTNRNHNYNQAWSISDIGFYNIKANNKTHQNQIEGGKFQIQKLKRLMAMVVEGASSLQPPSPFVIC